jgi:hypothetical protein
MECLAIFNRAKDPLEWHRPSHQGNSRGELIEYGIPVSEQNNNHHSRSPKKGSRNRNYPQVAILIDWPDQFVRYSDNGGPTDALVLSPTPSMLHESSSAVHQQV